MANFTHNATAASTKVIMHVDTSEQVADVINGRPYKLPANEPVELPVFAANALMRHIGHLHGIVEVKQVRGKDGVKWDVADAAVKSQEYLKKCEDQIVAYYVRQQMEDRVATGKPALPPTGRALTVILARKISLRKQYGLSPVGWSDPGADVPYTNVAPVELHPEVAAMKSVVASQNEVIAGLQAALAMLLEQTKALNEAVGMGQEPEQQEQEPDEQKQS